MNNKRVTIFLRNWVAFKTDIGERYITGLEYRNYEAPNGTFLASSRFAQRNEYEKKWVVTKDVFIEAIRSGGVRAVEREEFIENISSDNEGKKTYLVRRSDSWQSRPRTENI